MLDNKKEDEEKVFHKINFSLSLCFIIAEKADRERRYKIEIEFFSLSPPLFFLRYIVWFGGGGVFVVVFIVAVDNKYFKQKLRLLFLHLRK